MIPKDKKVEITALRYKYGRLFTAATLALNVCYSRSDTGINILGDTAKSTL